MTAAEPPPLVVRVRIRNFCWTSPAVPEDEARAVAAELVGEVTRMSAFAGFVTFDATAGRDVQIRARDITAIEVQPWVERGPEPAALPPPSPGPVVTASTTAPATSTGIQVTGAGGTGFLRSLAAGQGGGS